MIPPSPTRRHDGCVPRALVLGLLGKAMSLLGLMKEAIASGKLMEPFTSRQIVQVLASPDWTNNRVQDFLARHCSGNVATTDHYFVRVRLGRYRLLRETIRYPTSRRSSQRRS